MFAEMRVKPMRWKLLRDKRLCALPEGHTLRVVVEEQAICFVRCGGVLRALADRCPHQGMSLEGGTCEDGFLVCPWHRMSFDPMTGRNRFGMTADVPVFPVEEREGEVRIAMPRRTISLFGWKLW